MQKHNINPAAWSLRLEPRNHEICVMYADGRYLPRQVAARFDLTVRQVERIAKQGGVGRTRGEANRDYAALKPRHRIRRAPSQ